MDNLLIHDEYYEQFLKYNNINHLYDFFAFINRNNYNTSFPLLSDYLNQNYIKIEDLNKFLKYDCQGQIFYFWKTAIKLGKIRKITKKGVDMLEIIKKKEYLNNNCEFKILEKGVSRYAILVAHSLKNNIISKEGYSEYDIKLADELGNFIHL